MRALFCSGAALATLLGCTTLWAALPEWRSTVRLVSPDPALFANEHAPEVLEPEQLDCYYSLPAPLGGKPLPPHFSYVGGDRAHFIIPITSAPEAFLREGDVLVYTRNDRSIVDPLRDRIEKGRWHAAIVGRDASGRLRHFDSPRPSGGSNFTDRGTFHILRLREFPWGAHTQDDLKTMQSTPDGTKAVSDWQALRPHILQALQDQLTRLDRCGYGYDVRRYTQATIPADMEKLKEKLNRCETKDVNFYCSSLIATAYELAGVPPSKTWSILLSVDLGQTWVDHLFAIKSPRVRGREPLQAIQDMVTRSDEDMGSLIEMGLTPEELNTFVRTGRLPQWILNDRQNYTQLYTAPKWLRAIAFNVASNAPRPNGRFISPADYVDAALDPTGDFEYVGTWIGDGSHGGLCPQSRGIDQTHGKPIPGGLETLPNYLTSVPQHVMDVWSIRLLPDGVSVESSSMDGARKIVHLDTMESELVAQNSWPSPPVRSPAVFPGGPWKSTDGKTTVTADGPRSVRVERAGKSQTVALPFSLAEAGTWVEFSPRAKFLSVGAPSTQLLVDLVTGGVTEMAVPALAPPQFSPDETWFVVPIVDEALHIFSTVPVTKAELRTAVEHFLGLPESAPSTEKRAVEARVRLFLMRAQEVGLLERKEALAWLDPAADPARRATLVAWFERMFRTGE